MRILDRISDRYCAGVSLEILPVVPRELGLISLGAGALAVVAEVCLDSPLATRSLLSLATISGLYAFTSKVTLYCEEVATEDPEGLSHDG